MGFSIVFFGVLAAGVYCLFQGPGLSRWPYLVITLICSLSSATFVFVKACVAAGMGQWHRSSPAITTDALFLSSWMLAIAHMAVAYRTNCRERRKLVVYRIDLESVSVSVLSILKKNRSLIPVYLSIRNLRTISLTVQTQNSNF